MRRITYLTILCGILSTSTALAASLEGALGITGKVGALVPINDDFIGGTSESKTGLATGGGLLLGVGRNLALEFDATHVPGLDANVGGSKAFDASITDLSLGVQYRFTSEHRAVPYLGVGVDFIEGNLEHISGAKYDLDWTEGGHVNAGVDYFLTRGIALNADLRGVVAFDGDVKSAGLKVGEYTPRCFIATFGIRFIIPASAFNPSDRF